MWTTGHRLELGAGPAAATGDRIRGPPGLYRPARRRWRGGALHPHRSVRPGRDTGPQAGRAASDPGPALHRPRSGTPTSEPQGWTPLAAAPERAAGPGPPPAAPPQRSAE